jgi:hypothetical protein
MTYSKRCPGPSFQAGSSGSPSGKGSRSVPDDWPLRSVQAALASVTGPRAMKPTLASRQVPGAQQAPRGSDTGRTPRQAFVIIAPVAADCPVRTTTE